MNDICNEIKCQIAVYLSGKDLVSFCLTSKKNIFLLYDISIWRNNCTKNSTNINVNKSFDMLKSLGFEFPMIYKILSEPLNDSHLTLNYDSHKFNNHVEYLNAFKLFSSKNNKYIRIHYLKPKPNHPINFYSKSYSQSYYIMYGRSAWIFSGWKGLSLERSSESKKISLDNIMITFKPDKYNEYVDTILKKGYYLFIESDINYILIPN